MPSAPISVKASFNVPLDSLFLNYTVGFIIPAHLSPRVTKGKGAGRGTLNSAGQWELLGLLLVLSCPFQGGES